MSEPTSLRECVADCLVDRSLVDRIAIYFDGSCEPVNPGGIATCGWLIRDDRNSIIASGSREVCRGKLATNNVAEWCALGFALRHLRDEKLGRDKVLEFCGDSKLVVCQLSGEWACRKPHLQKLKARCVALIDEIRPASWKSIWIPRERNLEADFLSRSAYVEATGKPYPERIRG